MFQMNEKELQGSTDFRHSPDYRSVECEGKLYTFTSFQAQVVQILHEQYLNETPEVGKDYILEELGTPSQRLRDIFQYCPDWRELIVPGKKKGTYRLNLP